jgi:hypothetical protein
VSRPWLFRTKAGLTQSRAHTPPDRLCSAANLPAHLKSSSSEGMQNLCDLTITSWNKIILDEIIENP